MVCAGDLVDVAGLGDKAREVPILFGGIIWILDYG
jgi:hypothetical protein